MDKPLAEEKRICVEANNINEAQDKLKQKAPNGFEFRLINIKKESINKYCGIATKIEYNTTKRHKYCVKAIDAKDAKKKIEDYARDNGYIYDGSITNKKGETEYCTDLIVK